MEEVCLVCRKPFEDNHRLRCASCGTTVCPECLRLYQSKCEDCYFEEKNPKNMIN